MALISMAYEYSLCNVPVEIIQILMNANPFSSNSFHRQSFC